MKSLRWVIYLCIVLSSAALLTGAAQAQDTLWAVVTGVGGLFGLWAAWRGAKAAGNVLLLFFALVAAIGILRQMNPQWALIGLVAALAGWDLLHFYWRWDGVKNQQDGNLLARRHLLRLGALSLIGFVTAEMAILFRTRMGFGLLVLIGMMAIIMVGWVVNLVRRQN